MAWHWYLFVFSTAAVVCFVLTPAVIRFAKAHNVMDYPSAGRINNRTIPRLGGVGIFLGISVAIAVFALISRSTAIAPEQSKQLEQSIAPNINYLMAWLALAIVFVIGVIDDFVDMRRRFKFLGQLAAAIVAIAAGVVFDHFTNPFTGEIVNLGWLSIPITLLYLVAFANVINIIDGLDGLASSIAIIAALALFIISVQKGGGDAAIVAIAIAGSCLGFLYYNRAPARIFMGDSGSLTLGMALGMVSLFGVVRTPALISLLAPLVIAGLPLLDMFSGVVRRMAARRSPYSVKAGRVHQRLMHRGLSPNTTVLVLCLISILLATSALIFSSTDNMAIRVLIVCLLLIAVPILIWRLRLMEPVLRHFYHQRIHENKPEVPQRISASIVTYNNLKEIRTLLFSMQKYVPINKINVFIIDNASTDDTIKFVEKNYPWAKLIRNQRNIGFGAGHNQVIDLLESKYHVVINPDIEFSEDAVSTLCAFLDSNPEVAMVTPRILNRDGSEQKLPKMQPTPRYLLARRTEEVSERAQELVREYTRSDEDFNEPAPVDHATGSFFVIRTDVFCKLKGFDERFFMYFEDNDLSRRAQEFGEIIFYPGTTVTHGYKRASKKSPIALLVQIRSALQYFIKHGWSNKNS
ncbi:MAG: glycosyltransferase [Coriobacteriales bacterium]|jgi:UDP-GlcNAc:undecaprenyl-phosphate GlcNAc-1-phosphate transferase|nr:glycosyltransferase [Coriobacteriales bacterium]